LAVLTGCGGDEAGSGSAPGDAPSPPSKRAAEPARAPQPAAQPAGRVVPVGNKPEGAVFEPRSRMLAVGLTDPDLLALVAPDGAVRRRVRLAGAPRHLTLDGRTVLVPAEKADRLVLVGLPDGDAREVRVGDNPHDADDAGERIFVGDEFASTMTVLEDDRVVRTVPTDKQPGGVVGLPDRVGLVAVKGYTLELFDARSLRSLGRLPAGAGPTHGVADRAGRIHVTDTRGNAMLTYSTRPRLRQVGRLRLPGKPYGITYDGARDRLWVTLTAANRVVELGGGDRPRRLRSFPTVRQPNTIAVDERTGRLFIPSRTDGTLQLIDP